MEKGFSFYSNGKLYKYSASIDNSEVEGAYDSNGPIRSLDDPNNTVRGFTVFNTAVMERNPVNNEIKIRQIT